MADSKLLIEEHQSDDVVVLTLSGQILLDDGDLAFRRQIHDVIGRGLKKVIVDLGGVTYIDSSGVGMMAAKLKTVRDAGGDMKLVHLTSKTHRLLAMVKLLSTFEVFDDQPSAIRSFSWSPRSSRPADAPQ
jgi:anti-sigma B factor antagonist